MGKKHYKKYKDIINPTDIIFEEPKYFGFEETLEDHQNKDYWLNENDFRRDPSSKYNYGRLMGKSNVYFTNLSGWYSNFKSLQLAVDFEQKNNLKFDYIISIRADSVITKDINFTNYDKNYIHFQKKQSSDGSLTRMSGPRLFLYFKF